MMDLDERMEFVAGLLMRTDVTSEEVLLGLDTIRQARLLLRANMTPGFVCPVCKVFTGLAKEVHERCRNPQCNAQRPT